MGFISAPGPLELMVILVIALIVLGPKRLPETARSVGRGMRELRDSLSGRDDDYDYDASDDEPGEAATEPDPLPERKPERTATADHS
jgi:sec-independent protein translocase protein TatA